VPARTWKGARIKSDAYNLAVVGTSRCLPQNAVRYEGTTVYYFPTCYSTWTVVLVHPPFGFRDYLERYHGITPKMTERVFRGRFHACVTGAAELHEELKKSH